MTISVENLKKVYEQKGKEPHAALSSVSLNVEAGEIFGIIGGSGAGKSTLIRCLPLLEKPTSGKIVIDGEDMTALSPEALRLARRKLGMIFQQFNLFPAKRAYENVAFPLELLGVSASERKKKAFDLLKLVGLEGKEMRYPSGLSGGEKQRVAIARALASDPKVLLSDEATSSLDPRTTRSILELLVRLNKTLGLTILLITHEMEVIKEICTKVAVLDQGTIVESGPVESVFLTPQHAITRGFLETVAHELPESFLPKEPSNQILRLRFRGDSAKTPVISRMIRQHDVEVNILLGGIDRLRSTTVGNLVIELSGAAEERKKAIAYLQAQGVICEVVA